jgi:hypothetical protein
MDSLLAFPFQAQLPGDPVRRPCQLHAPRLGRAAELGSDLVPRHPLPAKVGKLPFLVAQSLTELLEQLSACD